MSAADKDIATRTTEMPSADESIAARVTKMFANVRKTKRTPGVKKDQIPTLGNFLALWNANESKLEDALQKEIAVQSKVFEDFENKEGHCSLAFSLPSLIRLYTKDLLKINCFFNASDFLVCKMTMDHPLFIGKKHAVNVSFPTGDDAVLATTGKLETYDGSKFGILDAAEMLQILKEAGVEHTSKVTTTIKMGVILTDKSDLFKISAAVLSEILIFATDLAGKFKKKNLNIASSLARSFGDSGVSFNTNLQPTNKVLQFRPVVKIGDDEPVSYISEDDMRIKEKKLAFKNAITSLSPMALDINTNKRHAVGGVASVQLSCKDGNVSMNLRWLYLHAVPFEKKSKSSKNAVVDDDDDGETVTHGTVPKFVFATTGVSGIEPVAYEEEQDDGEHKTGDYEETDAMTAGFAEAIMAADAPPPETVPSHAPAINLPSLSPEGKSKRTDEEVEPIDDEEEYDLTFASACRARMSNKRARL